MLIGRVVGDITSTRKHSTHEGRKILLVQPLNLDGTPRGNPVVALDSVSAGIGSQVLLVQDGFAAFSAFGLGPSPIDSAVVGIIDAIDIPSSPPAVVAERESPTGKPRRKPRAANG